MYFKTTCTKCKNPDWHDVHIGRRGGKWEKIYIKETVPEETLLAQVLNGIRSYIKDGTKISELCRILAELFGVAKNHCCDVIQSIKLELCLYSPDGKHLYYAY